MGMTIDEAVSWMLTIAEHEGEDITIYDSDVEAINIAIDIMRKYQKIEQIIKDHDNDKMPEDYWYIDKIREVIDDVLEIIDKYKAESEDKE